MSNFAEQIFEAVSIIVQDAVSSANYTSTIQAKVLKCIDSESAKYKLQYQDSYIEAYANDPSARYIDGAEVYVLIQDSSLDKDKIILGSVRNLGENYIEATTDTDQYEIFEGDCIEPSSLEFKLSSYKGKQKLVVYDKTESSQLQLNEKHIKEYLNRSDYLKISADFRTLLPKEHQYKGNFGMTFELDFKGANEGEVIRKSYTIDVDMMSGMPYQQITKTNQYHFFAFDKNNFIGINQIYFFSEDFLFTKDIADYDLFLSGVSLKGAVKENIEDIYTLQLKAKRGTVFFEGETEDKYLEAELKHKGQLVQSSLKSISYYWFRRNYLVNHAHKKYNILGGVGWECLNESEPIKGEDIVEWIPGENELTIRKTDVTSAEIEYKCVVVYDAMTFEKTSLIKNKDSVYEVKIESDEGTDFLLSDGSPTLTALVNGGFENHYNCIWMTEDHEGHREWIDAYSTNFDVRGNQIHDISIGLIVGFMNFYCSIYNGDTFLGMSKITLTNNLKDESTPSYNLYLDNGRQLFKYSESGLSPASEQNENPQKISELKIRLCGLDGVEIPIPSSSSEIEWKIPTENTMLITEGGVIEDGYRIVKNVTKLSFKIENLYRETASNNTIIITVKYAGAAIEGRTSLLFLKEGQSGTNGGEFSYNIEPNDPQGKHSFLDLVINADGTTNFSFTPSPINKWVRHKLWRAGELISNSVGLDVTSEEGKPVSIELTNLLNKYSRTTSDSSNIRILNDNFYYQEERTPYPANILKGRIRYEGVYVYDFISMSTVKLYSDEYFCEIVSHGGQDIIYDPDGTSPRYNNQTPIELKLLKNGVDITQAAEVTYEAAAVGAIYSDNAWVLKSDLAIIEGKDLLKNQVAFRPNGSYDGVCVSNAIQIIVKRSGNMVAKVNIPIHMYINRYKNQHINEWDGNSIEVNKDGGIILSPQVAAGRKETDNSFSGLVFGETRLNSTAQVGLIGMYHGEQTLFLDAETGKSSFGKRGEGQIIIDPSSNEALIYGGNYVDGKSGMMINLTKGSIEFGNGSFRVDENGLMTSFKHDTSEEVNDKIEGLIKDTVVEYILWDSETTPPPDNAPDWSPESPQWSRDLYIWSRTKTTYKNNTIKYSEPVNIQGAMGESPFTLTIRSSQGSIFKNGNISTILSAHVYRGEEEVTSEFQDSQFLWTRSSANPEGDEIWNHEHFGGSQAIEITHEDVFSKATFFCNLMDVDRRRSLL